MTISSNQAINKIVAEPFPEGSLADRHRDMRGSGNEDRAIGSDCSPVTKTAMTSTSQNTTAKPNRVLHSRAELRDLLIDAGLARAAAEKLSRGGWPALAEDTPHDLAEDIAAELRALLAKLKD